MEWIFIPIIITEVYFFLMDGNLISGFIAILATIIGGFIKIIIAQINIKKDIARIIEQTKEVNNKLHDKHNVLHDEHNVLHNEHKDIMNGISFGNKTIDTVNHYILNEKERQARIEAKLDGKIKSGIEQGAVATKLLLNQLAESKQEIADVREELKGLKEEINQLKEENQKLKQENTFLLKESANGDRENFSYRAEQSKDDFEHEL